MSTAPERPLSSLGIAVLNEVKSEIAVRNISGKALADLIGVSNNYLAKRLRGDMALSIADVEGISKVLGIDAVTLFARAADAHNARIATYETAEAPQRVTPTRPTASATTPRVAPAMASVTKFHDRHALTPAEEAEIMRLTLEDQFAASDPEDNDDTDQYEGA